MKKPLSLNDSDLGQSVAVLRMIGDAGTDESEWEETAEVMPLLLAEITLACVPFNEPRTRRARIDRKVAPAQVGEA